MSRCGQTIVQMKKRLGLRCQDGRGERTAFDYLYVGDLYGIVL